MTLEEIVERARVPALLRAAAVASLQECKRRVKGAVVKKWRVRLFKAGWIADQLPWESNRLIDVHPDLLDMDIEPVTKIGKWGDNGPWDGMPPHGRPITDCWLNPDPSSDEYRQAVDACYWKRGHHPRSKEAVRAWYRRNGGAGYVYRIGCPVDEAEGYRIWRGRRGRTSYIALKSGEAWQVIVDTELAFGWRFRRRLGFEVDNVFSGVFAPQAWFALPKMELKAPASWSYSLTRNAVYLRRDQFPGVEQTA
jgi:hypothetical protein